MPLSADRPLFVSWSKLGLKPPAGPPDDGIKVTKVNSSLTIVSFNTFDLGHAGQYGIVYATGAATERKAADSFNESGYAAASKVDRHWFVAEDHSN